MHVGDGQFASLILLAAVGAAPAVQPRPTGLDVILRTIDTDAASVKLVALSLRDGAVVRRPEEGEHRIPTEELVRVTFLTTIEKRTANAAALRFAGGDRIYGRMVSAADAGEDVVFFETADLGMLHVPLEQVEGIDLSAAASADFQEALDRLDRPAGHDEDRILLTNGDVLRGFITSLDSDHITLDTAAGRTDVPVGLAVAVRMAGSMLPALPRPYFVITLQESGRLLVTDLDWSGDAASARLPYGQHVGLEAERLVDLEVIGGRWEWIGDHPPISFEHTAMLALGWTFRIDRNVLGGPLTIDGERFERGVGVHSRSSLTYDLQGAYREFVASFGIDDDSGPYADATAIILVDGKRRHVQEHVRRGERHGPLRVDVARAKRIELVVDFGDNGDMQDRFDWIEAALIR